MRMKHKTKYMDFKTFAEVAGDGLAEMGNEILRRTRAKGSPLTREERSEACTDGLRRWRKITEEKLKTHK